MSDDAAELVRLGARLMRESAFEDAARVLEWAVEAAPEPEPLALLALCHLRCGRGDLALECARSAVAGDETNLTAQDALGLAATDQWHEAEALAAFDRCIQDDPTSAESFFHRGMAHFHFGRFTEAAADVVRSLVVQDRSVIGRLQRSLARSHRQGAATVVAQLPRFRREARGEREQEALDVLAVSLAAIEDDTRIANAGAVRLRVHGPLRWAAAALRWMAWRERGEGRRGLRLLDTAVTANSGDSALRWARAMTLRSEATDPRSSGDLAFLARRHRRAVEVAHDWVESLIARGSLETAEAENLVYLEQQPIDGRQLHFRAAILERLGRPAEELEVWNELVAHGTGDSDVVAAEAAPAGVEEDEDDELAQLGELERRDFRRDLFLGRAECLGRLGDDEAAMQDFGRAFEIQEEIFAAPANRCEIDVARLRRAHYWAARARLREALADLDECVRRCPGSANLWDRRAEIKDAMKDTQGAEADRREARRLRERGENRGE